MASSKRVRLSEIHGSGFSLDSKQGGDREDALPISKLLGYESAVSVEDPRRDSHLSEEEEQSGLLTQFYQAEQELERANALWWTRMLHRPWELSRESPNYYESSITGLMDLYQEAVSFVLDTEQKFRVIMALQWLKEQREAGRPLRIVHPSLGGVGMTEAQMEERLFEVLGTEGCRISLYSPILVGNGILVARQFTLQVD